MLRISYSPELYAHPLPEGHRFPMEKYTLIPEQLVYEGTVSESQFFTPSELDEAAILRTHEAEYWTKLHTLTLSPAEVRRTGFPLSERLVRRETRIAQGTLENALYALETQGVAINVAGGTHHAYTYRGEGFCLLNDMAIAANELLYRRLVRKILIVDLDVHQGNGTAQIFQEELRVFTFSMHGEENYPIPKEKSDLDIGLADGTGDAEYLRILYNTLPRLLDEQQPDFVFYLSGVDILETDRLGKLSVSKEGCRLRDKFVLQTCKAAKLPVAIALGGGYSPHIRDIVEAHCNTFRLAQEIWY